MPGLESVDVALAPAGVITTASSAIVTVEIATNARNNLKFFILDPYVKVMVYMTDLIILTLSLFSMNL